MSLVDQFRYFKIQPQTIDLRARLWRIDTEFVEFIPQSLALRSIVWDWILIQFIEIGLSYIVARIQSNLVNQWVNCCRTQRCIKMLLFMQESRRSVFKAGCQLRILTAQFPLLLPNYNKFSFNLLGHLHVADLVRFFTWDYSLLWNTGYVYVL